MHALGVDVGYGHTKALSSLRDRPLTFPSVVGRAETETYHLDLNGHARELLRGGVLMDANDEVYLYGEPAIRYARVVHQPRDRDWIRSQPYRVLWQAIVSELVLPSTQPVIVTGLPVRYYSADRVVLEDLVQHVLHARNLRPRAVIVVPQPFGSFFAHILDRNGQLAPERNPDAHLGIIDIGHFTTDFVEVYDCEHIEKGSGSLEVGIATVFDAVRRLADERWGRTLNVSECEAVVGGAPVRVKGQDHDLREATQTYGAEVAMAITHYARQLWGGGAALDEVLVTGGGAPLLVEFLRSAFSQLTLLSDAFVANARGYMQYALYRAQEVA
jgi:plasmid segregation protein ParM